MCLHRGEGDREEGDRPEQAGGEPLDVAPCDDGVDGYDHIVNVTLIRPVS
jgi:hypothetical protein